MELGSEKEGDLLKIKHKTQSIGNKSFHGCSILRTPHIKNTRLDNGEDEHSPNKSQHSIESLNSCPYQGTWPSCQSSQNVRPPKSLHGISTAYNSKTQNPLKLPCLQRTLTNPIWHSARSLDHPPKYTAQLKLSHNYSTGPRLPRSTST